MAQKVVWVLAALLYGSAALVLVNFNWSFWLLLALGTIAAIIGTTLPDPEAGPKEAQAAR